MSRKAAKQPEFVGTTLSDNQVMELARRLEIIENQLGEIVVLLRSSAGSPGSPPGDVPDPTFDNN